MAKKGVAMPDGSFPIPNRGSLGDAIRAVGRARPNTPEQRAKVRRHIIKRARALGATDMIPDTWRSNGTMTDGSD
jgi:hypothetical protein